MADGKSNPQTLQGRLAMDPHDVFTPRNHDVNPQMYIDRVMPEYCLNNGLKDSRHLVIHGDSGTGKSWLYKKVLKEKGFKYDVINLSNAVRFNSITKAIEYCLASIDQLVQVGQTDEKSVMGSATAYVVGTETTIGSSKEFEVAQKDPYEVILSKLASRGGRSVLVFDNFELIFNKIDLMQELSSLIMLLDDPRYAQYKVKLILVGTPSGIREYFVKAPNYQPVANRLYEIPEISRLEEKESHDLINRGLFELLKIPADDKKMVISHVDYITDRIPQAIHEYCLELSVFSRYLERPISIDMLRQVNSLWLQSGLSKVYQEIELAMNSRETKVGRRNQALYVLGLMTKSTFTASVFEEALRKEFPDSTQDATLNIPRTLSELMDADHPILKRTTRQDHFAFCDPQYKIGIRAMLYRKDGAVLKNPIEEL